MILEEKFDPLVAEWLSFVNSSRFNLVEKCLKLAQLLEYSELDVDEYVLKITRIGKSLKESINDYQDPISILNEHLFENLGFSGDNLDYYNPKNNFLNDVIDKKSGLPITLSVLYVEIAKFIGLDLKIVGFPGHILVKHNETILDPFHNGISLDNSDLQDMLNESFAGEVKLVPSFLNEIPTEKILIRLVRNLKNSYAQSYNYEKALRCTNMVLSMESNSPEDLRDKGILEDRMLNSEAAIKYLNLYLEASPNAEDVDFILELLHNIKMKN